LLLLGLEVKRKIEESIDYNRLLPSTRILFLFGSNHDDRRFKIKTILNLVSYTPLNLSYLRHNLIPLTKHIPLWWRESCISWC